MNYIGAKLRLSDFLLDTFRQVVGDMTGLRFADLFAGTGAVTRAMLPHASFVAANDWEMYSYVLLQYYLYPHTTATQQALAEYCAILNELPSIDTGFIYRHYCWGSGSGRQYFSDANGKRIDAIRQQIAHWHDTRQIDDAIYYGLLAALILHADRVANTASVYGAFLKHLKSSAQKELTIQPLPHTPHTGGHQVFCADANTLIQALEGDILYLDPPYNARQYGANYHLLNTITEYSPFEPQGKTGLRPHYTRSRYCQREAAAALKELLQEARFRYIFLSYNNEGILSQRTIREIMSALGHYVLFTQEYTRFRADKTNARHHTASATMEYVHCLEKR